MDSNHWISLTITGLANQHNKPLCQSTISGSEGNRTPDTKLYCYFSRIVPRPSGPLPIEPLVRFELTFSTSNYRYLVRS